LSEFTSADSDRLDASEAILSLFAEEFETLCNLRDQLIKEERFQDAMILLGVRVTIGKFLSGSAK
jgi:hypothetical protein